MFTKLSEKAQCNGHYAVQGHSRDRFWYQSKAHNTTSCQWLILAYLISCTVFKLWLIIRQIFATERECLTLTLSLNVIPCQYNHKWYITKKLHSLAYISAEKCPCIVNHFYVICPEIYRMRWNYADVRPITLFKVIQGHRFKCQSKAHFYVTFY